LIATWAKLKVPQVSTNRQESLVLRKFEFGIILSLNHG
jgi:hypothetical protein